MTNPRIVLLSTIEAFQSNMVYEKYNTPEIKNELAEVFNFDNGIRDDLDVIIMNHPDIFPNGISNSPKSMDYDAVISSMAQSISFIDILSDLFDSLFTPIFSQLENKLFDSGIVINVSHLTEKPNTFTHFIGWVINIKDYDFSHIMEHESITLKNATILVNTHNDWLYANKTKFDLFFDGSTPDEVLVELNKLI